MPTEAVKRFLERPFKWNAAREKVAVLLAKEDDLTLEQIGAQVGFTAQAIVMWKQHAEFRARVDQHVTEWKEAIHKKLWTTKEKRLEALMTSIRQIDESIASIDIILRERGGQVAACAADDLAAADVHSEGGVNYAGGARTGYIARDYRGSRTLRAVYQFDSALMREKRELVKAKSELMRQLAIELGQWQEAKPGEVDRLAELLDVLKAIGQPPATGGGSAPEDGTEGGNA